MSNEYDRDLRRLFSARPEPEADDAFTERVSRKITRIRRTRRATQLLLGIAGVALLALLTPWLTGLIGFFSLGADVLAACALMVLISPAGWVLGGCAGLLVYLRVR